MAMRSSKKSSRPSPLIIFDARLIDFTLQGNQSEGGNNLPTVVDDILDCMHAIVTNGIVGKVQFFELFVSKVKGGVTLLVWRALESEMIALMPSLRDYKFREFEFLTFLLSKSSLKSFAFSTM